MSKTPDGWDKDAWIRSAIKAKYLICEENGTIWRRKWANKTGDQMSSEVRKVVPQIHKASGRVFFNLTWLGITKSVLVNRVIAWAFIPNPHNLPQVNHIDGDKENNAYKMPDGRIQLEWSSGRDNEIHAHRTGLKTGRGSANSNAKLTAPEVIEIRRLHAEEGMTPALIAQEKGIGRSTVLNIIRRKTWIHV